MSFYYLVDNSFSIKVEDGFCLIDLVSSISDGEVTLAGLLLALEYYEPCSEPAFSPRFVCYFAILNA